MHRENLTPFAVLLFRVSFRRAITSQPDLYGAFAVANLVGLLFGRVFSAILFKIKNTEQTGSGGKNV